MDGRPNRRNKAAFSPAFLQRCPSCSNVFHNREFKKTTTATATATATSLNKRFNEQNNSCARAL